MVEILIYSTLFYLVTGTFCGVVVSFFGIKHLDPAAKNGTIGFKLLIIPGLSVFWPFFMYRWMKGISEPPVESNSHRDHTQGVNL